MKRRRGGAETRRTGLGTPCQRGDDMSEILPECPASDPDDRSIADILLRQKPDEEDEEEEEEEDEEEDDDDDDGKEDDQDDDSTNGGYSERPFSDSPGPGNRGPLSDGASGQTPLVVAFLPTPQSPFRF
jgi:hypothetical protein